MIPGLLEVRRLLVRQWTRRPGRALATVLSVAVAVGAVVALGLPPLNPAALYRTVHATELLLRTMSSSRVAPLIRRRIHAPEVSRLPAPLSAEITSELAPYALRPSPEAATLHPAATSCVLRRRIATSPVAGVVRSAA